MTNRQWIRALGKPALLSCFLAAFPVAAQVVADGASRTLLNETNSFTGDVTVGTNGSFTLLVLSGNALLTNSVNGIIGRNATAKSNEVRLVTATSRWLIGGTLFVGSNGSYSRLIVSNGAQLRSTTAQIGRIAGSGSNVVLVTGSGSTWSNMGSSLGVGLAASGNQLLVRDGGRVVNPNGSATIGNVGFDNLARVTGSNSVWTNFGSLSIGVNFVGNVNNRLFVEDGGAVFDEDGFIGGGSGSMDNAAIISGPGALWSSSREMHVGGTDGRSLLVVSNGGTVRSGFAFVGLGALSHFNRAVVTGVGSVWTNQSELTVGGVSGQGNQLFVADGGTVLAGGSGTIGADSGAANNSIFVSGPGGQPDGGRQFVRGQQRSVEFARREQRRSVCRQQFVRRTTHICHEQPRGGGRRHAAGEQRDRHGHAGRAARDQRDQRRAD